MHARNDNTSSAYLLTMLVTSALALLVLGSQVALNLSSDSRQILDYADDALCAVFFIDFCVTLWRSPNRIRYFFTWGWVDLLSSIPSIDAFRLGRVSRVFRIFRVLRAIRAAKILAEVILLNRAKNVVLAITLIAGLLMVFASIGILHVETVPEANIKTPEDALWWAAETITTVGYGDKFPVTSEGRMLGVLLMVSGVSLIGAYTGFVAFWFLKPLENQRNAEIEKLLAEVGRYRDAEISSMRAEIESLRAERDRPTGEPRANL